MPGSVSAFNTACRAVAVAWLVGVAVVAGWVRPTTQDFPQYYLGGLCALTGQWAALYPVPRAPPLRAGGLAEHRLL